VRYYPIFLDLLGLKVVVVGGGAVAERKVRTLLQCGAKIVVVSPWLTSRLTGLAKKGSIHYRKRTYRAQDLQGATMVLATTDNRKIQQIIVQDARRKRILVNVADRVELCDFIAPSILRRGDLTFAFSTGGASPGLAQKLRRDLGQQFGQAYADFLHWMGPVRQEILRAIPLQTKRRRLFQRILNSEIIDLLKKREREKARRVLSAILTQWGIPPLQRKTRPNHRRKPLKRPRRSS
jgi:precorrin-2 dehydrogenase / sirohydrochlorin ferrochelatase